MDKDESLQVLCFCSLFLLISEAGLQVALAGFTVCVRNDLAVRWSNAIH